MAKNSTPLASIPSVSVTTVLISPLSQARPGRFEYWPVCVPVAVLFVPFCFSFDRKRCPLCRDNNRSRNKVPIPHTTAPGTLLPCSPSSLFAPSSCTALALSILARHSIFDFDPAYLDTAAHPDSPISPRLPLASTVSHQITALREKDNNCRRVIHNRLFSFPPAEPLLCGPLISQPDSNKNNTLLCCPRQVSDLYRYWL